MHYSLDIKESIVAGAAVEDPFGAAFTAAGVLWTVESRDPVAITGNMPSGAVVRLSDRRGWGVDLQVNGESAGIFERSEATENERIRALLDGVCRGIRVLTRDAVADARRRLAADAPRRIDEILARFDVPDAFGGDLPSKGSVSAARLIETFRPRTFSVPAFKVTLSYTHVLLAEASPSAAELVVSKAKEQADDGSLTVRVVAHEPPLAAARDRRLQPGTFTVGTARITNRADGGYEVTGESERLARILEGLVVFLARRQAAYLPGMDRRAREYEQARERERAQEEAERVEWEARRALSAQAWHEAQARQVTTTRRLAALL